MGRPKKEKPDLELKAEEIVEKLHKTDEEFVKALIEETANKAVENYVQDNVEALKDNALTYSDSKDKFARNPDGSVNWRKMVKAEYVTVKKECVAEIERLYKKPITEIPIEQLEDKYLLILLHGIRELADLRGYKSVRYPNIIADKDFASVYCEIEWLPFENIPSKVLGDGADAHYGNTNGFAQDFLTTIAFNRAFVRAVKNYLKINILGNDEIGSPKKVEEQEAVVPSDVTSVLSRKINNLKNKKGEKAFPEFSKFRAWRVKQGNTEAEAWNSVNDIPDKVKWELLAELKEIEDKQAQEKE